jgi:hypothetical protein
MSDTQVAQPAPFTPQPGPAKPSNGLATAGFVLGLLGLLGSFIPVLNIGAMVIGVVGAVLAAVGLTKAKKSGAGKGLAIAGVVLGVLALIISIVINVAFANAVDDAVNDVTETSVEAPADEADDAATDDAADEEAATDDAAEEEAEPVDEAVGTSRDNPAPLGSAITGGDWTVTINSVTTADADSFGQAPAAGSTLLVVNITATYNGSDSQGATPWSSIGFVTAEGTTIDGLDGSTLFVPDQQFDSLSTVYEGASVTGNQMIEVPADGWQNGVLAVSPDLMADDTFVAVQ